MGSAFIVTTVSNELIGLSPLRIWDPESDESVPIEKPYGRGPWMPLREREALVRAHPDAFWMMPIPYSAVWRPPNEPDDLNWHWQPDARDEHRERVRRSLEAFLNAGLARLDRMVRSGWFIIERARATVTEFADVPHNDSDVEWEAKRLAARDSDRPANARRSGQHDHAGPPAVPEPTGTQAIALVFADAFATALDAGLTSEVMFAALRRTHTLSRENPEWGEEQVFTEALACALEASDL